MAEIQLKFKSLPTLIISINDSKTSTLYLKLLEKNIKKQPPIFRDNAGYTKAYLKELAYQLKKDLNWNWMSNDYTIEDTTRMHKEIENILNKEKSFANIPEEFHDTIHEAHFCIHAIEWYNPKLPHGTFLQVEWFNDDHEDLPDDANFTSQPGFGDIILQNPYVGHPPIQCWEQNDYKNIMRTCQFHDKIKPGLKINLTNSSTNPFPLEEYKNWWTTNAPNFIEEHSLEKILKFTGFPCIGKVSNLLDLELVLKESTLIFESINIKK